jgi:DnaJ-class molecular chaperone
MLKKLTCKAYEILTDPKKRDTYDRFGKSGLENNFDGGLATFFNDNTFGGGFFETIFGFNRPENHTSFFQSATRTDDFTIPIESSLQDLYAGTVKKFSARRRIICPSCKGSGALAEKHIFYCKACKVL